jgi:hypothetical protein
MVSMTTTTRRTKKSKPYRSKDFTLVESLPSLGVSFHDQCHVISAAGVKEGPPATFLSARVDSAGNPVEVNVLYGYSKESAKHLRTFRPDRIRFQAVKNGRVEAVKSRDVHKKPRTFSSARYHYPRADFGCIDTVHCLHTTTIVGKSCKCCGGVVK